MKKAELILANFDARIPKIEISRRTLTQKWYSHQRCMMKRTERKFP